MSDKYQRGNYHVERIPILIGRYSWTLEVGDYYTIGGWAATRWGARRAATKAARLQGIVAPIEVNK